MLILPQPLEVEESGDFWSIHVELMVVFLKPYLISAVGMSGSKVSQQNMSKPVSRFIIVDFSILKIACILVVFLVESSSITSVCLNVELEPGG